MQALNFVKSSNYADTMRNIVEPELEKIHTSAIHKKTGIYYDSYKITAPKATIIISHGMSENAEKFKEMIYYFVQLQYNVFAIDHRGHGRSKREVEDSCLVHINKFDDYAEDLHVLMQEIFIKEGVAPFYLYGHSMGGAIAIRYLELYPKDFEKAVLSSPMTKILLKPISETTAYIMASTMCLLGKAKSYGPGQHAYVPGEKFEESASSNEERFRYYTEKREATKEFQLSGTSYKWVKEAIKATRKLRSNKECSKIVSRVLLFGSPNDSYVDSDGHKEFLNNMKNAEYEVVEGSKHEIYNSDDSVVESYVNRIERFYSMR